jgi:hypothetical protein
MTKEYYDNIDLINYSNCEIKTEDIKFYLLITTKDDTINYKIIEKDKIWIKNFTHDEIKELKNKMGFDGSWKAYFTSLNHAINRTMGGDLSIKHNKDRHLILSLFHPLTEDFKIKSEILFDNLTDKNSEAFSELTFEFVGELYESIRIINEKAKQNLLNNNVPKEIISAEIFIKKSVGKLDIKKPLKRKYNANLINPNVKKRKGNGNKFTEEDDVEECEGMLKDLKGEK